MFVFDLGISTALTISLDSLFENIRSGSNGIIISLPKQKNLSYLLKFSNQEGKFLFMENLLFQIGFFLSNQSKEEFIFYL
jgi:hypothetical protein